MRRSNRPFGLTALEGLIGVSLLGGLVLIASEMRRRRQIRRLRERGRQTQAIVFDCWMTQDTEGSSSHFAAFVFQIPAAQGGLRTITRAERNQAVYDRYRVSDALTVEYLADKPSVCRVRSDSSARL